MVIRVGPLLRCWLEFCPFGIVLPGLLVASLLGSFLTRAMFVSWLLWVLLMIGFVVEIGFVVFQGSAGGAGVLCDGRVLGGFQRIRLNRKTPARLASLGSRGSVSSRSEVWKRLMISEAPWCPICGTHVLHECHHSDDGNNNNNNRLNQCSR